LLLASTQPHIMIRSTHESSKHQRFPSMLFIQEGRFLEPR
jgi:hypothetical protein